MKKTILLSALGIFLFSITSQAKGTGASGRGSGAHAAHAVHVSHAHSGSHGGHVVHVMHGGGLHHTVFVTPIASNDEDDHFQYLRTGIFNGYIVYGNDTLGGILTCTDNIISLKMNMQDSTYMFNAADSNLKYIYLNDNGQQLSMLRMPDKRLYRVMHSGKLNIYDTYYSFDYLSKDFYNERSIVVFNGRTEKLNETFTINVKKKLIGYINEVYNTNLNDENMTRDQLLGYVQHMN